MAYPTVSAPYGLQPVNRIDGMPYAGAIRQIPVAAGFATAIFNGDTVLLNSDGYLIKSTTTNSGGIVGVCVGGSYINSSGQPVQGQYIPAGQSTASNLAYAYVVDDPNALFKVAVVAEGATTMSSATRAVVGSNLPLVLNAGSTTTGDSAFGVTTTGGGTTATIPVRVIDVVPETATAADTYVELLVKINTHQYNNTTGV